MIKKTSSYHACGCLSRLVRSTSIRNIKPKLLKSKFPEPKSYARSPDINKKYIHSQISVFRADNLRLHLQALREERLFESVGHFDTLVL